MNRKEYSQKYYLEHKEHMIEIAKNSRDKRLKSNYKRTREKSREYNNNYRKKHREQFLKQQRKDSLKSKFNLTLEEYDKILIEQHNCCAICKRHISEFKKSFCVDHNHITNKVRGLLCAKCNTGLGMFDDNIDILNNAIQYLGG